MTKRLANLIYKVPEGTKVDIYLWNGSVHDTNVRALRDQIFEKGDVFESDSKTITFYDLMHLRIKVKREDIITCRERRGKLVEIPKQWVGKVTNPQTIRKRKSKAGQGARYRSKAMR